MDYYMWKRYMKIIAQGDGGIEILKIEGINRIKLLR
jgi:hypothetical protein